MIGIRNSLAVEAPALSVTAAAQRNKPAKVGTPLTAPVRGSRLTPGGSNPPTIDHE